MNSLIGEAELSLNQRLELSFNKAHLTSEDVEACLIDALFASEIALADVVIGVEIRVYKPPVNFLASSRLILISEIKLHLEEGSAGANWQSESSLDTRDIEEDERAWRKEGRCCGYDAIQEGIHFGRDVASD